MNVLSVVIWLAGVAATTYLHQTRPNEPLQALGAAAVFGPGSNIPRAASEILHRVRERRPAA